MSSSSFSSSSPSSSSSRFRSSLPLGRVLPTAVVLAELASLAAAYSFNIVSTPRQCENLTVQITGDGGQPPYSLLIIPVGPSPLPNATEVRKITNVAFGSGSSASADFQLAFPENSQFVAVVSDNAGFGTGGTSAAVTVLSGNDGCFNPTQQVSPQWFLHTTPDGVLNSCVQTRIWWNPGDPQGTPNFQGVIPGGDSFSIPVGPTSTEIGSGVGFNWTADVREGTTLLLVGGDDRGLGVAGSNVFTVQRGSSSCLNDTSPSSTPGSPAGGSYPTSTDGSGTRSGSGSSGSSTNVGAIVGGVVGGVVGALALALLLVFVIRRRRFHQSGGTKERPVDLLQDNDHDGPDAGDGRLPEYYQPEPFVLPDPTVASSQHDLVSGAGAGTRPGTGTGYRDGDGARRESFLSTSTSDNAGLRAGGRSSAPSTSARKSPVPPSFRPVNIIQHDDAGPPEEAEEEQEPETIELPPAYTNIKPREVPKGGDAAEGSGSDAGASAAVQAAA
ncbi:hypothetical protein BD310DRAFT_698718 [Dichomitus squalens]|uniref:Uncharacterized protein n=1 Tax=Dichomitus squalens TaxID=114155 RepID=A0A4Q9Q7V8_9APHY|nr:hypothetical protein BD310DRAFT_698718 [Dichomitus squalens]